MRPEVAYELLLWVLLVFCLSGCALAVICVVLYRRLIATNRALGKYQSLLRPDTIPTIPKATKMTSATGNMCLSQIAGSVSLNGSIPSTAETKTLVIAKTKMKQITAIVLPIAKLYKRLNGASINKEQNPGSGSLDIANGTHIASPGDKMIPGMWSRQ